MTDDEWKAEQIRLGDEASDHLNALVVMVVMRDTPDGLTAITVHGNPDSPILQEFAAKPDQALIAAAMDMQLRAAKGTVQ